MKEKNAILLLLLTAFIWGMSFVAQSVSADSIGPFSFNSIRFFIGALVLIPFTYPIIKSHKGDGTYMEKLLKGGFFVGMCLSLATVTQQAGISYSGAGKGGFITSLYIIIVPFISLLGGKKIQKAIWISALGSILGLYLLSSGGSNESLKGDLLLLLCALFFAFHILTIDKVGKDIEGILLSQLQFLFAGLLTLPGMIVEAPSIETLKALWLPIGYAGVFSCGIAYTLQVVGQKYVKPQNAVLVLSLESVFAALGGAILIAERMTGREILGAVLVFVSVLFAELSPKEE